MSLLVDVGGRTIGDPRRPFVVGEMAWAHDGRIENALRIVDLAADAGADAINVHLTDLPSYMVRTYGTGPGRVSSGRDTKSTYEYLSEISLGLDDWRRVAQRARERGLALSVMCNDAPSLELADSLGPDLHVIAPAVIGENAFVSEVASRGIAVSIGVGGSSLAEIEATVLLCRESGAAGIIIQYGYQAYPTKPADLDLRYVSSLRDTFGCPIGYHDHTDSDLPAAFGLPLVALGAGATILEKHLTHDRSAHGEDFESALDAEAFRRFVALIRGSSVAIGTGAWRPLNDSERAYRSVVRKRMVARRDLAPGTPLSLDIVAFKRSDAGLPAADLPLATGRRLRRWRRIDDPIDWADLS